MKLIMGHSIITSVIPFVAINTTRPSGTNIYERKKDGPADVSFFGEIQFAKNLINDSEQENDEVE